MKLNLPEIRKAYKCLNEAYHALRDLESELYETGTQEEAEEIQNIANEINSLQTQVGKHLTDYASDDIMNHSDLSI